MNTYLILATYCVALCLKTLLLSTILIHLSTLDMSPGDIKVPHSSSRLPGSVMSYHFTIFFLTVWFCRLPPRLSGRVMWYHFTFFFHSVVFQTSSRLSGCVMWYHFTIFFFFTVWFCGLPAGFQGVSGGW